MSTPDLFAFFAGATLAGLLALRTLHAERRMWRMRRMDNVTGLPGRELLERDIARRLRRADQGFSLLALDFSGLREITETHGWPAGDAMLEELARRLGVAAGRAGMAGRLAGTDFAVLLPGLTDAMEASAVAKAILAELEKPFLWQSSQLCLRPSAGLVMAPRDAATAPALMHALGTALAAAKPRGPGALCFFDVATDAALEARRAREAMVRDALARGLFRLHWQPVYELASGHLKGFEALLRLTYPGHGPISPQAVVEIAEETGLINELGAWTLEEACRTAQDWPAEYKIAVNLSALQFRSGNLVAQLRNMLEAMRFPAYRLELEVTEGLLLENHDHVRTQLNALAEMGVRLVLDDFGTGYSSLSYLWQFPFAKLKIDQSFVRNLDRSPADRSIVETVIGLARRLHIQTVAEGIEEPRWAELLRKMGCELGQGYHWSKPIPAVAFWERYGSAQPGVQMAVNKSA